jgi:DNA-binding beta-propeller fold protein YncE
MSKHICRMLAVIVGVCWSPVVAQQWTEPQHGWLYVLDVGGTEGNVLLIDPVQGTVKGRLPTAYHPNFGMCNDGSRLYVLDGPQSSGFLSIVETKTGSLVKKVAFQDRAVYTVRPSQIGITCSVNNRWLFVHIMRTLAPGVDQHSLAIVDATTGVVLPQSIALPDCWNATVIPWPSALWDLAVQCGLTNTLRLISLDSGGAVVRTQDVSLEWRGDTVTDRTSAFVGPLITTSASALNVSDHSLLICSAAGGLAELDTDTLAIKGRIAANRQLWAPRCGVVSPTTGLLYIGLVPASRRTEAGGMLTQISVVTTTDWNEVKSSSTKSPFWSLVINHDGKTLYTVNPEARSLTEIDALALKELKTVQGVGKAPSLILIQP